MDKLATRVESKTVCHEHLGHKLRFGVSRCDIDDKALYISAHNLVKDIAYLAVMISNHEALPHLMLEHIAGETQCIIETKCAVYVYISYH